MTIETVNAARNGSSKAMLDLLTQISGFTIDVIRHYLGEKFSTRIDAEDVRQEVLMQVATDLAGCTADTWEGFQGWLYIVCRNNTYKAVEWVKAMSRDASRTQAFGEGWEAASEIRTADTMMSNKETLSAVMAMAAGIEGPDWIFESIEHLAVGNTPAECAAALGIDVSEVYYARRLLCEKAMEAGILPKKRTAKPAPVAKAVVVKEADPVSEPVVEVKMTSAERAQMKQWKQHGDLIAATTDVAAQEKMIRRLEKSLARLPECDRYRVAEHMGFEWLLTASV